MAAQELLIFDAGENLLGESSCSLFDCLDCDTGVDDLLSDGQHSSQMVSPMASQLMHTFTEDPANFDMCAAEQEPALGFPTQMSLPGEQTAPIPCMAQELELQARELEEQHSMQALESTDEAVVPRVASFMPIIVHNTTRPAVISFTHSSSTAPRETSSKGDSKPKSRSYISSPANLSLVVKNNQVVQSGQGCMQPGAWRGCKKSAWCNRENRHRGLCNSRATIPGAEAYNQNAEPAAEKQQTVAESPAANSSLSAISPVAVTPTAAQIELEDSEPGSCSDLDTHSVYAGLDPPLMVQQQQLQPLVHCHSMSSDEGRLSAGTVETNVDQYLHEEEEQLIDTKPLIPLEMHHKSETDYSEGSDSEEEEEIDEEDDDDISVCSGSTISAGGQSCTVSDMFTSGFDEAYSDGSQLAWGSGGPIRTKHKSNGHGLQKCVNAGFPGQACTACRAQSTPVWRAGPMGPKTLCNACGVRWMKKSKGK